MFEPKKFIEESVEDIKKKIGKESAITAVSGGVDSFVAATLATRAIPDQLHIIYVNNGLMRKDETEKVKETAKTVDVKLHVVDAEKRITRLKKT